MYTVSPKDRERFFLRLLLLHVRGATSFADLKTYESITYDSFENVCRARGLLIDDTEWERTLREASSVASSKQLRELGIRLSKPKSE